MITVTWLHYISREWRSVGVNLEMKIVKLLSALFAFFSERFAALPQCEKAYGNANLLFQEPSLPCDHLVIHKHRLASAVPSSRCKWGWLNSVSLISAIPFCLRLLWRELQESEVELDFFEGLFIQGVSLLCISLNLKQLRLSLEPERCPGWVIITSMHLFGREVRGHFSPPQAEWSWCFSAGPLGFGDAQWVM